MIFKAESEQISRRPTITPSALLPSFHSIARAHCLNESSRPGFCDIISALAENEDEFLNEQLREFRSQYASNRIAIVLDPERYQRVQFPLVKQLLSNQEFLKVYEGYSTVRIKVRLAYDDFVGFGSARPPEFMNPATFTRPSNEVEIVLDLILDAQGFVSDLDGAFVSTKHSRVVLGQGGELETVVETTPGLDIDWFFIPVQPTPVVGSPIFNLLKFSQSDKCSSIYETQEIESILERSQQAGQITPANLALVRHNLSKISKLGLLSREDLWGWLDSRFKENKIVLYHSPTTSREIKPRYLSKSDLIETNP
jgi:hypothetical protein